MQAGCDGIRWENRRGGALARSGFRWLHCIRCVGPMAEPQDGSSVGTASVEDPNQKDSVNKYLRDQVAKWKGTVSEVEDLLDACMRADDKLNELVNRCRVPTAPQKDKAQSSADLEIASEVGDDSKLASEEAFVRSRMGKATVASKNGRGNLPRKDEDVPAPSPRVPSARGGGRSARLQDVGTSVAGSSASSSAAGAAGP